jgi:hypothetical protein
MDKIVEELVCNWINPEQNGSYSPPYVVNPKVAVMKKLVFLLIIVLATPAAEAQQSVGSGSGFSNLGGGTGGFGNAGGATGGTGTSAAGSATAGAPTGFGFSSSTTSGPFSSFTNNFAGTPLTSSFSTGTTGAGMTGRGATGMGGMSMGMGGMGMGMGGMGMGGMGMGGMGMGGMGMGGMGMGGMGMGGGRGRAQQGGMGQQQQQYALRPTLKLGFEASPPNSQIRTQQIQRTMARIPQASRFVGTNVQVDGSTAVVSGSLDKRQADLLKQILLLEPGIYKVDMSKVNDASASDKSAAAGR